MENAEEETINYTVSIFRYMPAFMVAFLKDILDFIGIGSLPAIGTVITFCFSLLIFFLLMLAGSSQRYRLIKDGLLLLGGTMVEGLFFGLNLLPLETLTVWIIYRLNKNTGRKKFTFEA